MAPEIHEIGRTEHNRHKRKALRSLSTDVCEFIHCCIEDNAEEDDDSESMQNLQFIWLFVRTTNEQIIAFNIQLEIQIFFELIFGHKNFWEKQQILVFSQKKSTEYFDLSLTCKFGL